MAHLEPLIEATQADEVMVTTMIYDHEARKHSYELHGRGIRTCHRCAATRSAKQEVPS